MRKAMTVEMKWNQTSQKWLMSLKDRFIYDFWDCGTMQVAFERLDKTKANKFRITIEKLGE